MNFSNAQNNGRRHGQLDELRSIPFAQVDRWASPLVACARCERITTFYSQFRLLVLPLLFLVHRLFSVLCLKFCLFFCICESVLSEMRVRASWANEYSNSLEFDLFTLNWHRNIDLSRIFIHIWFFVPNENGFSFLFVSFFPLARLFFYFILPRAIARSRLCIYAKTEIHIVLFECANWRERERKEAAVIYVLVVWHECTLCTYLPLLFDVSFWRLRPISRMRLDLRANDVDDGWIIGHFVYHFIRLHQLQVASNGPGDTHAFIRYRGY